MYIFKPLPKAYRPDDEAKCIQDCLLITIQLPTQTFYEWANYYALWAHTVKWLCTTQTLVVPAQWGAVRAGAAVVGRSPRPPLSPSTFLPSHPSLLPTSQGRRPWQHAHTPTPILAAPSLSSALEITGYSLHLPSRQLNDRLTHTHLCGQRL